MIRWRRGRVLAVEEKGKDINRLRVLVEGREEKALNYPNLTGEVRVGDEVVLNTTAVYLGLGTGGFHFVAWVQGSQGEESKRPGHLMKVRYTPFQVRCLGVEEEASPFHQAIAGFQSLEGMPVVTGSLHSQVAAAAAAYKATRPGACLAYVMTDGGALPLAFSQLVRVLKQEGLIDTTITAGHAFGGDLEAVNLYSALIAAREAAGAEAAIVCMGPGVVGTGTPFGTTALEQGQVVNAVAALGGTAVAIPRLSFADRRDRHRGLSHHTVTALGRVAMAPAILVLPQLEGEKKALLEKQLEESGLPKKHRLVYADGRPGLEALARRGIRVSTMGRGPDEDPELFLAAGAAGVVAAGLRNCSRREQA